jgi:hypothetical protein
MLTSPPADTEPVDHDTPSPPTVALCVPLWAELPPTGVDTYDVLARRTQRLLGPCGRGMPW